jgi:hypothetical protein
MRGRAHWNPNFLRPCDPRQLESRKTSTRSALSQTQKFILTCCVFFCQHTRLAFLARNLPPDTTGTVFVINLPGFVDKASDLCVFLPVVSRVVC